MTPLKTRVTASRAAGSPAGAIVRPKTLGTPPITQRGLALIAVLLLALVSLAVGILVAASARTELRIAHNQVLDLRALAVAEAGINHAKKLIANHGVLNDELAANDACTGNGVGTSNSGLAGIAGVDSVATLASDGRCYRFASYGSDVANTADGYYVRVEDNHDEASGSDDPLHDGDGVIFIVAHGVVGTAERVVRVKFKTTPSWGVYATGFSPADCDPCVELKGSPATVEAQVGANGNIRLTGNSQIQGDAVTVGTVSGTGTVTGTTTTAAKGVLFDVVPACGPPYSANSGISPGSAYDQATGEVRLAGATQTLTLTPGTYCFSSLTLTGNSTIVISDATVINMTGAWDTSGGTISNTSLDPAKLQVNSSCASGVCVKAAGGSGAYMELYNPTGEFVLSGLPGAGFFGSVIAKSVTIDGKVSLHQTSHSGAGAKLSGWHEVQNVQN